MDSHDDMMMIDDTEEKYFSSRVPSPYKLLVKRDTTSTCCQSQVLTMRRWPSDALSCIRYDYIEVKPGGAIRELGVLVLREHATGLLDGAFVWIINALPNLSNKRLAWLDQGRVWAISTDSDDDIVGAASYEDACRVFGDAQPSVIFQWWRPRASTTPIQCPICLNAIDCEREPSVFWGCHSIQHRVCVDCTRAQILSSFNHHMRSKNPHFLPQRSYDLIQRYPGHAIVRRVHLECPQCAVCINNATHSLEYRGLQLPPDYPYIDIALAGGWTLPPSCK